MARIGWIIMVFFTGIVFGQSGDITLRPNRGQWYSKIDYLVGLQGGNMYLEQHGFTFLFYQFDAHNHDAISADSLTANSVKTNWINANVSQRIEQNEKTYYRNYFLGSDQTNWKTEIHDVQQVVYTNKYNDIDLEVTANAQLLKYSWIVKPGGDYKQIQWSYSGAESVQVQKDGSLKIIHLSGEIFEGKPIAWTLHNGERIPLKIKYAQKRNSFYYEIEGTYLTSDTLIIDPSLTFSSFTGSTSDNWGFTAAPDPLGNLYAGGIVFGTGYPVTTGVVSTVFNGGTASDGAPVTSPLHHGFDVGISKFNATGTAFIFSTYLGGSGNETPHSIVSDAAGNMFLLGVTSSTNFPMLANSYDNSFNGGPTVAPDNLKFVGSDIYVISLNSNGTSILGATYFGGTGTDGINFGTIQYNYGDNFRGEIIVDNNFVYFASVTQSTDFPTQSASQSSLNGAQDAVAVKLTKDLSTLVWSTYYGGPNDEAGYGIQLSPTGSVYLVGGTNNGGLNFGAGGFDATYNGGRDGFIVRLNSTTSAVMNGSYVGTVDYDQLYFVQIDNNNDVYVFGQTAGDWSISAGCYGTMGSGQLLMKFNPNLSTQYWVTTVGASTGNIELSPTAFLVSNCKDIYISGWGGVVNQQNSQATTSSSNNLPVTSDAFQSSTSGNNFWIAVLSENAASLKYATFMGGTASSYNHVDGGTSRFDKNGNIYHAVCGACGGNNFGFTTTPDVVGPENLSVNCNLAAFKFELSTIDAVVVAPNPLICIPDAVVFQNNSANGNSFLWNFGDGSTSSLVNPSHNYANAGQYTVTLVVTDTTTCYAPDSLEFIVNIGDFNGGVVNPQVHTCNGAPAQLEAYGGSVYTWTPAQYLNNPNISNPLATVTQNTTFTCIISDSCGVDTVTVDVLLFVGNMEISNDTTICVGSTVPLHVNGVSTVTWQPATYLDNPSSLTPNSIPSNTITYVVNATTNDGCEFIDSITIFVDLSVPVPILQDTLRYCLGASGTVTCSGGSGYFWSPNSFISSTTNPAVTISSDTNGYYYCDVSNACGTVRDSVYINTNAPNIDAGNDTSICMGELALLWANGGAYYTWSPNYYASLASDQSLVFVQPQTTTTYLVTGFDSFGCSDTAQVTVTLFPPPFVQANPDVYAVIGEVVQLNASATQAGSYTWSPTEFLSCVTCQNPITQPDQNITYTVTFTDLNGCVAKDAVSIHYDPLIYVPNTFTPNANGVNEFFFALGVNLKDFKMEIYNRWGELIFTANSLEDQWDGTYAGLPCPDGVYTWKIEYGDIFTDVRHSLVGHVSLLR